MYFRMGLMLAGSLAVAAAGCASGTGAGTGAPADQPRVQGEVLEEGERPRQNDMTRAATDLLEQAEEAESEAQAEAAYQSALEQAQMAVAADSTNPLPWYQGGRAHVGLRNFEEADEWLARATDLRPIYMLEIEPYREQTWIDLYQEAQPFIEQSQFEEAVEPLAGANEMYRERPEVMILLGQIYSSLGEYQEAADLFRQAHTIIQSDRIEEMDSTTAASWREQGETLPVAIADLLIAAGDYDEAVEQLRLLRQQDPDDTDIIRSLAMVYVETDQPDSAVVLLEDLANRPGLASHEYYQVGIGFYNLNSYEDAADAFEAALDAAPRNRDAAEMVARSLQLHISQLPEEQEPTAEQLSRLENAASAWVDLDPFSRNAHLITAQAANQAGNEDRARELVQAIEELSVTMENLQLQANPVGGGTVTGQIMNQALDPGTQVTVSVTFYGEDGATLGTEQAQVQLPAQEATVSFRVTLESDQTVGGYSYEIQGL